MNNADRLAGMSAFVQTAEAGSFSAAAQRMCRSRSAVAKSVGRLEERLGVRLIHRTTRSQSLTAEGIAFYARCLRVLEELEQAEAEIMQGKPDEAVGKLTISMPVQLGARCIAPVLTALCERHPRLRLDLTLSDRRVDLFDEGYDLAIRSGVLADSSNLRARRLGTEVMVVCAAPHYLARHGVPADPAALEAHAAIAYGRMGSVCLWHFHDADRKPSSARLQVRLCCDDLDVMLQAAMRGLGVTRVPLWLAAAALQRGELIALLPHLQGPAIDLHAIWPRDKVAPARLRIVIDALVQALPAMLTH
jgi:DNA-binding transcriptional LysR family regulator